MRYLLFAGEFYYPCGGIRDLVGKGSSVDSLIDSEVLQSRNVDWFHIFDTESMVVVAVSEEMGSLEGITVSETVEIFKLPYGENRL